MGLAYPKITLKNPRYPDLQAIETDALANTGAVHLCIPSRLALQLNLETFDQKEVTRADGSRQPVPYMGPVQLSFKNRTGLFGAIVFGNEVLLGAIPLDDMATHA